MRYVSKPTECEARRWVEATFRERRADPNIWRAHEIVAWVNRNGGEARCEAATENHNLAKIVSGAKYEHGPRIAVRTINGWAYAAPGHYIVMGSEWFWVPQPLEKGGRDLRDFYPCDPETFEKRWAAASESREQLGANCYEIVDLAGRRVSTVTTRQKISEQGAPE